ncbi:hypothetical protein [Clostridium minihomine]|uniref:hypothetical protein n=1 Tax=Clostridium minihomine TaxID=2045012 RepID=UPI00101AD105|nr:hypothetical protein [Clostridium minihomine]
MQQLHWYPPFIFRPKEKPARQLFLCRAEKTFVFFIPAGILFSAAFFQTDDLKHGHGNADQRTDQSEDQAGN